MTKWLAFFGILFIIVAMFGCGTTRDTQSKTVEKLDTMTGPLVVHTPMGDISVEPVRHQMVRSEQTVEKSKSGLDMPEAVQFISAATGGTPWGGILSAVAGLGAAAFAVKKAIEAGRQRNELIDGIERAKADLGDKWETLTSHLEAEQSKDTKAVVRKHTA